MIYEEVVKRINNHFFFPKVDSNPKRIDFAKKNSFCKSGIFFKPLIALKILWASLSMSLIIVLVFVVV